MPKAPPFNLLRDSLTREETEQETSTADEETEEPSSKVSRKSDPPEDKLEVPLDAFDG